MIFFSDSKFVHINLELWFGEKYDDLLYSWKKKLF